MKKNETLNAFMIGVCLLLAVPAWADVTPAPAAATEAQPWVPMLLGAQYTGIHQHLSPFGAAYSGPLSFTDQGDTETSHTFGAYFGLQFPARLQAYLDIEMFKGDGVGGGTGLGGLPDGDVVRAGTGLPKTPYVARAYLQYSLPLGDDSTSMSRAQDQLPGEVPVEGLSFKAGKLSVADDFDQNRYADSVRTQFENLAFVNNLAWDYAADTRGYTDGVMVAWTGPVWTLRFSRYRMPLLANHQQLEWPLTRAYGDNLELDWTSSTGTVLRFLLYRNVARMGVYDEAIAIGAAQGKAPDIVADDRDGRVKTGYGFNMEQPLADGGDTGLFLRAGWDDGRTESFAYAEVDRTLSLGAQLSGVHWGRGDDRVGLAIDYDALSSGHAAYLAAGGCGFILCDGKLNYGYEKILEGYYRAQLGDHAQLGPDIQYIFNPGYNRDRGPARIVGLRLRLYY